VLHRLVLSVFCCGFLCLFSLRVPQLLLFFQRVVIMGFCLNIFAMRQFSFSSVLAVPVFRSIGGKPFLTRRCTGAGEAGPVIFDVMPQVLGWDSGLKLLAGHSFTIKIAWDG
jgi:hypothetical protein